jgi:ADP-ribosylglycohydrolase
VSIPTDYEERVYAGVLGKIIGVYLGRPVEGWTYERITEQLGEITGYVHDKVGVPLIVTDDDITGTFTFFRALEDSGYDPDLGSEAVGRAWLNYLIENRTILWWGGLGHSTEHTAYLRLKSGIPAPRSGSAALNGRETSEQIGAQIFIDAWAMACPGDPARAAALARTAASVSHDGEAVHAATLLAVMEAQAFVEGNLDRLLDTGLSFIPRDSVIARLIGDLRDWRAGEPDWRVARERLAERYGYHRYHGNVHVVPNHGLMILSLLWGDDDFSRTLSIVNTGGWDTDCNSGNIGCLMGIKVGLAGLSGTVDWRGPVADRLYLPSAEGGRAITDAVIEAGRIATAGRRMAGDEPVLPKGGARFHFEFDGAVQGFAAHTDARGDEPVVMNVEGGSAAGRRSLRCGFDQPGPGSTRLTTPTFIPPSAIDMIGYQLLASPTLHAGQELRAAVQLSDGTTGPVEARLVLAHYTGRNELSWLRGPGAMLERGGRVELSWQVPETGGQPIAEVGVEVAGRATGAIHLDWLSWSGAPTVRLGRPADGGTMWRRAWIDAVDVWEGRKPESYRFSQNRGTGLISQGSLDWTDYRVEADVTPWMAAAAGVAARVQGLRRYYALLLCGGGRARVVRANHDVTVLADVAFDLENFRTYALSLEVVGPRIRAWVDGVILADVVDESPRSLHGGAVALVCEEGTMGSFEVRVAPAATAVQREAPERAELEEARS